MLNKPTHEQALALAAVFQACQLVDNLANTGTVSTSDTQVCMAALLNQDPSSIEDLYGPRESLQCGITAMTTLLGDRQASEMFSSVTLSYALTVLTVERQLSKQKAMLDRVAAGLENAKRQAEHFSNTHDNVFANLASLYQTTLSTLRQRIQIKGNATYLQQPKIAERIRCLLFSAVRSAYLWHQLGGRKYHLVLYRKALVAALKP